MRKTIEMDLELMPYVAKPDHPPKHLMKMACANDETTCESWRNIWINQSRENKEKFGPFKDHNVGKLFGINQGKACLVAGAGPSLGNNIEDLKNKGDIPLISVLHNFHYMIDHGIKVDYFVTLDAGENITLEEMSEGGKESHEFYLEKSKDYTLCAFIGTSPKLLEAWQGEILFFNAPIPDRDITVALESIEPLHTFVGNGGNVLGACVYLASVMGSMVIGYIGADFSFSYTKKFHPWDSKYDGKVGAAMRALDIFGNSVLTWNSYWNFKCWFEYIAMQVPKVWINCSEGGTLGAQRDGNMQQILQWPLSHFISAYNLNEPIRYQYENPENGVNPATGDTRLTLLF